MVTNKVQRRPVIFAAGSAALLLAAALPLTTIKLGSNGMEAMPRQTATYQGFNALRQDFATGLVDPMRVVVSGDVNSPAVQQGIARFQTAVQNRPGLQWVGVTPSPDGKAAIIEVASSLNDTSDASLAVVDELRTQLVPQAFAGSGATVNVGGNLPAYVDVKAEMDSRLPIVFGFVLGLSFLLLLVVFRSVVIPAKAIVMNLLSVGAAYGLIVLVFQHGFLADQLHFQQTPQVEFWLPLFLFSILFGLSMDYHVFLLSRIAQPHQGGVDPDRR
jgi:RND superfamily putative drug exporter